MLRRRNLSVIPVGDTPMPPHLLVALTPHGFGHAAMTSPIVGELRRQLPGLRLTLQTAIPRSWLETRFGSDFDLLPDTPDFGMRMHSALGVKVGESFHDYRSLHEQLDVVVEEEAARLRSVGADLLLSNIPYVSLLAARRIGLPTVAYSCLNWADVGDAYFQGFSGWPDIADQIRRAYETATVFLCPRPSLAMPGLNNIRSIGPVALRGREQSGRLRDYLGIGAETRIGLITFGGMPSGLGFADWPRLPGWRWVSTAETSGHPDMVPRDNVPMDFTDILRSSDLLVGKTGYGTFTEAAVNGVPMLYVPRVDWPESPGIDQWLARNGRCLACPVKAMFRAELLQKQLQKLFSFPAKPLVEPSGIAEAVSVIRSLLS